MINFQNPSRPIIHSNVIFHDWLLTLLMPIGLAVLLTIFKVVYSRITDRRCTEGQQVEFQWTVLPCLVLLFVAVPSLRLLYLRDEHTAESTVKCVGNQWYWLYDYGCVYESYIIRGYRFYETDHRLILPKNPCQILVTAADVLHSWTLPSMGVKADAVPGRINKLTVIPSRPGVFYGQCSEICGSNHRFMPIAVEVFNYARRFESGKYIS